MKPYFLEGAGNGYCAWTRTKKKADRRCIGFVLDNRYPSADNERWQAVRNNIVLASFKKMGDTAQHLWDTWAL